MNGQKGCFESTLDRFMQGISKILWNFYRNIFKTCARIEKIGLQINFEGQN